MATQDLACVVEGCKRELEWLLRTHQGRPLPRCWSHQPHREEEITLLEEELLPAMAAFLERLAVIEEGLEAAQEEESAESALAEALVA